MPRLKKGEISQSVPTDSVARREYMRELGRRGGKSRSPAKLAAIRINARKPKKNGKYCYAGTIRSIDNPPFWGVVARPKKPSIL